MNLDAKTTIENSGVTNKSEIVEGIRIKLEEILKLIVHHPDEVQISLGQGDRTTIFKIECSKRNYGRILGSGGKMISSLRNIALALTARHGIRSIVEIPYFQDRDAGK